MPSARQIDELEELLQNFHITNHAHTGKSLEYCTNARCVDAKLAIVWLRAQQQQRRDFSSSVQNAVRR
jgi:hypothetical protein